MKPDNKEHAVLLDQLKHLAQGLGETFAPFCEVVVHDLLHPEYAILAIHNNLSGRAIGAPATELGLARIADANYPQIIANYANHFSDGRQAKSTSIGIKDSSGRYVAALCLNIDLSVFRGLQNVLDQFDSVRSSEHVSESLDPAGAETIRRRIDLYAARLSSTARTLTKQERRVLLRELKASGCLEVRHSMETVARYLGVSRATVYNDVK
jgi:predicted transcriptional regulator YheO